MKQSSYISSHHAALLLGAVCAIVFGLLATFVSIDATRQADERVLQFINTIFSGFAAYPFVLLTAFGGSLFVAMAACIWAILLLRHRQAARAFFVIIGVGGAAALSIVLKLVFARPRPELWEWGVVETSFAFPSSHAISSSALALAMIYLAWRTTWRWRIAVVGLLYTLSIGLSRLVLGVHYPSDIMGGWLVSGVWMSVVWVITAKSWPKAAAWQKFKNLR